MVACADQTKFSDMIYGVYVYIDCNHNGENLKYTAWIYQCEMLITQYKFYGFRKHFSFDRHYQIIVIDRKLKEHRLATYITLT